MLRSFTTDQPFRTLTSRPFEHNGKNCVFGKHTVIYGRNGSGKTTLAELLRQASGAGLADGVTVTASVRDGSASTRARLGSPDFPWKLFVYDRFYVKESLGLFLEGAESSPPILKIGVRDVGAAKRLESMRASLAALSSRHDRVSAVRKLLISEREVIEREVKSDVIAALASSDAAMYNKTTFNITHAKVLLADKDAKALSDTELKDELAIACAPVATPVDLPPDPPSLTPGLKSIVNNELLAVDVDSQLIGRLTEDRPLSNWVEAGASLHQVGDLCQFCQQGTITTELLVTYRRHFSKALEALRQRLEDAITYFTNRRSEIDSWVATIPDPDALLVTQRAVVDAEVRRLSIALDATQKRIDEAVVLIEARLADPLVPLPAERRLTKELSLPDVEELRRLLRENNSACTTQASRRKQAQQSIERHYAANRVAAYRHAGKRVQLANHCLDRIDTRTAAISAEVIEVEQSQQDTGRMANLIDEDLRFQFGHSHLRIVVSDDRKGYVVRRGPDIAKQLSEGERNAIAFSYFLRSLEQENVSPDKSIVIIDDPVTSLDKEALFAAFALAEERTKDFAQTVFLTHNYEFFRLQLNQRSKARRTSQAKIKNGDKSERDYPAVSVLEVFAMFDQVTERRQSVLRELPAGLLRHTSEYHYLFSKVAGAIEAASDDQLPLLGNAARRLLEGFIAFRAPNATDFQSKVDAVTRANGIDAALSRRVSKFLNGQSHRDYPRPTTALDFPSVEDELKTTLDFIRRADSQHFEDMCKAVGIDCATLIKNVVPGSGGPM